MIVKSPLASVSSVEMSCFSASRPMPVFFGSSAPKTASRPSSFSDAALS